VIEEREGTESERSRVGAVTDAEELDTVI